MSDSPIYDNVEKPTPIYGSVTGENKTVNEPEEDKTSLKPVAKVAAAGIAGAITVLVVFAVNLIWPDVEIPNEVAAAFTAIVAFAAGYIKKS